MNWLEVVLWVVSVQLEDSMLLWLKMKTEISVFVLKGQRVEVALKKVLLSCRVAFERLGN